MKVSYREYEVRHARYSSGPSVSDVQHRAHHVSSLPENWHLISAKGIHGGRNQEQKDGADQNMNIVKFESGREDG